MSREKKPRIATEAGASAAWQPFAALHLTGLPAATPEVGRVPKPAGKSRGRVIIRRSTAHRGGKVVTIVDVPIAMDDSAVEALATLLRKCCSTGGTVRERTIEVQGDRVFEVCALLEREGFRVVGDR